MNPLKLGIITMLTVLATSFGFAQVSSTTSAAYGKKAEGPLMINPLSSPESTPVVTADDKVFKITKMPFNSKYSDICPVLYGGGLVFSSSRKRGFFTKVIDKATGKYFYDLYFVPLTPDAKPKLLKGKVNTRFHDGPASVTKDGKTIYFSRSNFIDGKFRRSKDGVNKLRVLSAQNNGKKWVDLLNPEFNSDEFSVTHPSISPDGKTLYFASDMPGGFGGMDIWFVKQDDKGKWSKPSNLGSRINTSKNENFPSIHESGVLFFSSNGHKGQGGLDLFYAKGTGSAWDPPQNMGDINSTHDDFGITWVRNKPSGFFSSDREGNDNIYRFEKQLTVQIQVVQAGSGMKLPGAKVKITDTNNKVSLLETNQQGTVEFFGKLNREYLIEAEREYHEPVKQRFSTKGMSPVEDKRLTLELVREYRLVGNVKDAGSRNVLSGADVKMIQGYNEQVKTTDSKGNHIWKLEADNEYTLIISKNGFIPQIVNISTKGKKPVDDLILNTRLQPGEAVLINGTTVAKADGKKLDGVNVRAVHDEKQEEYKATVSMHGGRFWMVLDTGANYTLIGSDKGYFSSRVEVAVKDSSLKQSHDVNIEMIPSKVGEIVSIIYFDYNKSDITKTSSKELFGIVYFLKDNPSATVELGAHTDSRGGDTYNEKLSSGRAQQAVNFIVTKGNISNKRISAKGYGESQLVNKCKDGVECSDDEHGLNRRAEIKVTKLSSESTDSDIPESNR